MTTCETVDPVAETPMLTVCVAAGLTPSESDAVKLAVPMKPFCSVTLYVTVGVPWPAVTMTLEMPFTGVADHV